MSTRQREKAEQRRQKAAARDPHATLRYLRISPRKVRLVVDLIREKNVAEALTLLTFSAKAAAKPVIKLVHSAIANADAQDLNVDNLVVKKIYVDEGPTWRRWQPRAMGRATRIRKRTSHVTVELGER